MRMEFGADAFGHDIDDGFADLAGGQRSGFSVARRKQPLLGRLIRRGGGEERQEVFDVDPQELDRAAGRQMYSTSRWFFISCA